MEIITGFPVWLSERSKMTTANDKRKVGNGILGVKGREIFKIHSTQATFMKHMNSNIKKNDYYMIYKGNADLINLIEAMMHEDPAKRISPR